jgi:hypothetical protein
MRLAVAASTVVLIAALTGLGSASPALATDSHTSPTLDTAQKPTCSTERIDARTAKGWCNGGTWRLGIQCTVGQRHYYSRWLCGSAEQRTTCARGGGTMTHYWVDQQT